MLISPQHEHELILKAGNGTRSRFSHYYSLGNAEMTIYFDEFDSDNSDECQLEDGIILSDDILDKVKAEAEANKIIRNSYLSSREKLPKFGNQRFSVSSERRNSKRKPGTSNTSVTILLSPPESEISPAPAPDNTTETQDANKLKVEFK